MDSFTSTELRRVGCRSFGDGAHRPRSGCYELVTWQPAVLGAMLPPATWGPGREGAPRQASPRGRSSMDVVTLLIAAAFYVLFAVSIRRYLQHRGALELAVVLVVTSTAALFAVSFVNPRFPAVAPFSGPIPVTLLVAQPALMVGLVGLI